MKKDELIISPKNPEKLMGTMRMDAAYIFIKENKRVKRALTDGGDVVLVAEMAAVKKADIFFNSDNDYTWSIDLSTPGLDREKIIEWISEHPEVVDITGKKENPNLNGPARFTFSISSEISKNSYDEDDQKAEVFAKYNLLDQNQREAVSVNFGIEPWGKDEKELRNELVGFVSGKISCDASFRNEFLNKFDKIMDPVSINLKSGIMSGVVIDNGSAVIMDGEVLGNSFESAYALLSQRDDLLSLLERSLKAKGRVFVGASSEGKGAKNQQIKEPALVEDLNDLEPPAPIAPRRGRPKED